MVDKTAAADLSARMDFDTSGGADELRENARGQRKTCMVKLVAQSMQQDGMESGVTEKDLDSTFRGGIATENGIDLFPEGAEHGSYL
jgi:hypothetical protein